MFKSIPKIFYTDRLLPLAAIYLFSFLLVSIAFHHLQLLQHFPFGIHFIRQTDSLSFELNYYLENNSFFEPALFDLRSVDGKGAAEFPIIYYLLSLVYRVFGFHPLLHSFVNIFFYASGFFCAFLVFNKLLKETLLAILLTLLLHSSAIVNYYGLNYIPDIPAMGFTFYGLYLFFRYLETKSYATYVWLTLCFTLAGLLKASFLVYPVGLLCFVIFEWLFGHRFKSSGVIFLYPLRLSLTLLTGIFTVFAWYYYVRLYNQQVGQTYFLTAVKPIWTLTPDEISNTWEHITGYWYNKYFPVVVFQALFVFAVGIFAFRCDRHLKTFTLLLFAGMLCYFFLFYASFRNHDYYFIATIPFFFLLLLTSAQGLLKRFGRLHTSRVFKVGLLILVFTAVKEGGRNLQGFYFPARDSFYGYTEKFIGANTYLDSMGIQGNVVVFPDMTPNGSLYYMQRKGITFPDTGEASLSQLGNYLKMRPLHFLAIGDTAYLHNEKIHQLLGEPAGTYNGILFYRIKHPVETP